MTAGQRGEDQRAGVVALELRHGDGSGRELRLLAQRWLDLGRRRLQVAGELRDERTVKRASPVRAAARAPCPATSPIMVSHPAGVAKAS